MKKSKLVILLLCIILLGGLFTAYYTAVLTRPFPIEKKAMLYIDADDNIDSVYHKVKVTGKITRFTTFKLLATLTGYPEKIHPGAYSLSPDYSCWTLIHHLKSGQQTPVNLILPSARTVNILMQKVARQIMADSTTLAGMLADTSFCKKLGYTPQTLPALFIPNTYQVYWTIEPEDFFARMQKEHKRFWNEERQEKAKALGLTLTEVVTLASIVDEETANNAEKPTIAGLYLNRLRIGMPLQADPTVKFALNNPGLKRILHKHLEVESPYNTYKHAGLPPGPIRIPSVAGIESVLNAKKHNFLYMCAKETLDGTHNFASNLSEHQKNAQKYQRELNRRKIK